MFITCSKNPNLLEKRFSKYLTKFLPDLSYIPRGKTSLKKIFEKAIYVGHKYFLKTSHIGSFVNLNIYAFKNQTFFLEREYSFEILDLRHFVSFSELEVFKNSFNDAKKLFYFLKKDNLSLKSKYGVFFSPETNTFNFLNEDKPLGFNFKIVDVKKYD